MKRIIGITARLAPILSVLITLAFLLSPANGLAVDWSEYEYEPDQGLHQEEWYDPGDWFDTGPGVDYERDWYDYTYNYPYGYDNYRYGYDDDVYGYYGKDDLYDYDYDHDYDYYSDDWYDREGAFEDWF
ncbi:MAG: hypothetical protein C4576_03885 [Desulfobacteraceae bacterium]|nr:MAG: hypothetical protein C4576_03885 [Desulfobacteraceae bacterium]